MKLKVTESQKDALTAAAQLALITGDIQYDAYKLILDLAKDEPQLLLNGRQMQCCDLSMMETRLTGIVLLIPAVKDSRGIRRLIAYVPHDPDHPLKEYDSTDAFMDELSRQLRENKVGASSKQSYRQFFSQFVDHQQRGHFFAGLDQRLVTVRWHEKADPTDQRPTWREDPVPSPAPAVPAPATVPGLLEHTLPAKAQQDPQRRTGNRRVHRRHGQQGALGLVGQLQENRLGHLQCRAD